MFLLNKNNEKVLSIITIEEKVISLSFERPNFYGIFFFTSAKGILEIDDQELEIRDKCIFFYYPFQKLKLTGRFEGWLVQFHPDFFCIDIHAKDVGCQGLLFNNFLNDTLLRCSNLEFDSLFQFVSVLSEELQSSDVAKLDMVSSQLKILLIMAVRIKLSKQEKDLVYKEELHYKIEQLIEAHFLIESSPDFYANQLNISITKFNRLCQKYFKNSFIRIVTLRKVAMAKNKLFLTENSVKELAYDLGYNDPLYFSRVFRKYAGVSPKEFRDQLKNNRLI